MSGDFLYGLLESEHINIHHEGKYRRVPSWILKQARKLALQKQGYTVTEAKRDPSKIDTRRLKRDFEKFIEEYYESIVPG